MSKYVLVPVEPTDEMLDALFGSEFAHFDDSYRAAINRAPSPWRPIRECPDDETVVCAWGPTFETVGVAPAWVVKYNWKKATHFILASDFPLPVEQRP